MTEVPKHPIAKCEECTLLQRPYVPTYVPEEHGYRRSYNVLWVGQAPGDTEALTKIPFTGSAGKMHYGLCKSAGLNKPAMPHTNSVQCYPVGDAKPTGLEVACCNNRLKQEIQEQRPNLIVALGDIAMYALTGLSGITSNRGRFVPLLDKYEYTCQVLICLHPSFVMRQRQWIKPAVDNYKLIHDFMLGNLEEEHAPNLILDPSPNQLETFLNEIGVIYAVDTETTGLNPRTDTILGHSFAKSRHEAISVMYENEDDPRLMIVRRFMEDKRFKKCWQNGSFDTEFLRTIGIIDDGFIFDTRLAQQMLNSDLPSDLDFLRSQYTNIKPYKPPKREMKKIATWGKSRILEYAALDAATTYTVMREQMKLLGPTQIGLMQDLLIPLVRAIGKMERRGCLIDVKTLAAMYARCQPIADSIEKEFGALGINPRSPQQLAKYFRLKSTNVETLQAQMLRGHPKSDTMQRLLDYRKVTKQASVYLKGVYKRLENGRIHTHYKIEGTGTGRLSSENPNLQNIPAEMKVIYISDPDHVLVCADYSQIELWVGALIAEEDQMIKDMEDGVDIHFETCKLCFPHVEIKYNDRKKDFNYKQQWAAKSVNFGTFYGRTPLSIAREFGVTTAEAENWQLKVLNKYPKLLQYKRKCERAAALDGHLSTPFGRLRYVETIQQAYNFPVQSTASDITLQAIVIAERAGLWVWSTVHDEITFQVPLDQFDTQLATIRSIMERPVQELGGRRFKADYKKGTNWRDLEVIDVSGVPRV